MANIDNIVNVNATIEIGGLIARDFGITLFVTTDSTLPSSNPLQAFASFNEVASVFPVNSIPYQAGQVYFGQTTTPANLLIGRWFNTDYAANLVGAQLPALSVLQAISDGAIVLNGAEVTGIDFTSATSYTDIASILQTELGTASPTINGTVDFDSSNTNLIFTNNIAGSTEPLTYASSPASGTDLSTILGWTETTGAQLNLGVDMQTIEEAMQIFVDLNNIFYLITLDPTFNDTQTILDLSAWVFDRDYFYYAESTSEQVLNTGETTSIFAQLFAEQSSRTAGDWNDPTSQSSTLFSNYLSVSSASRISNSAKQLNTGLNVLINPKFKDRPLISPAILNTSQQNELDRKRINNFVPVGGGTTSQTVTNIYQQGYCFANGIWQDVRIGVDWWVNAIKLAVLNLLLENDRVTQTVIGQAQIVSALESPSQQAVRNGLLAAGQVSQIIKDQIITITGNSQFNGFLPKGYLIYPVDLSTLSEAERVQATLPPFFVWGKGSGAVNSIDINLFFDQ